MVVKGLFPVLKAIARTAPLKKCKGLSVAVDAMAWLHKGVHTCDVNCLAKYQYRSEEDDHINAQLEICNIASYAL